MTDTAVDPRLFGSPAERRAFRNEIGRGIGRYVPPELRPLLGLVAEATPSAAVDRAGAAASRAVAPDRTAMERLGDVGQVLSETAGVVAPAVVAGRAGMPAAQAVQEAVLGASVPARSAADTVFERLNQPGPMPETLYSGFGPTGGPPRMTIEEMRARARARIADREATVSALMSEEGPVRFESETLRGLVSRSPDREGWRLTYFMPDGTPTGHSDMPSREAAVRRALEYELVPEGGMVRAADRAHSPDLPPPQNAQRTQIAGTLPTYLRADQNLEDLRPGGRTLDFGAGLGLSQRELGYDTFEPYPREGFNPTFRSASDIPDASYDRVTSFNVLNVVPRDVRDGIVSDIGRVLAPDGVALITTRGRDVMTANGTPGPEPMSIITSRDTYQKGFTPSELEEYVQGVLGSEYSVSRIRLGPAGVQVRRLPSSEARGPEPEGYAKGGAVMMRSSMPQEIERGVGSLADVARGMFRGPRAMQAGGEVSVNALPNDIDPRIGEAYRRPGQGSRLGRPISGPAMEMSEGASEEFLTRVRRRVIAETGLDPIDIAMERGIDPDLFLRLIAQESGGDQGRVSEAGAIGLTQLMPETAAELGVNPRDAAQNLRGGAEYLGRQLETFQDVPQALAAYNAGPGRISEYGGLPPFSETRGYVSRITGVPGGQMAVGPLTRPEIVRPEPRPIRAEGVMTLPATRPMQRPAR